MIDTRGAGVSRLSALCALAAALIQTTGGPALRQPTRRQVAVLRERMSGAWRARHAEPEVAGAPLEPEVERRFAALDQRLGNIEAALEALQDALYRQSVRADERHADMRERTDPTRLARDLSADARRRGL